MITWTESNNHRGIEGIDQVSALRIYGKKLQDDSHDMNGEVVGR